MPTILVADDDRTLTAMLRRTLAYEGYDVLTAADGREALAQAQAHHPDLVVLDWLMPGLDGLTVARRLRAGDGPPILMLTAAMPSKAVSRAWIAGPMTTSSSPSPRPSSSLAS